MISIIVPVYNVKDYLVRCVDSIIKQDYEDIEVLLVDDGSNDGSENICDDYAQRDSRIRVFHKQNGGLSSARNMGLEAMAGEYVFFVDSDDYILPGILKELFTACVKYDAEIACCGYITGNKKYYCSKEYEEIDSVEACKRLFICDGIDANAVCKLYASRLFTDIRYPLCAYEVVPVTYRVLLKANKVVNTYLLGYCIEKRIGSITRSRFGYNNLLYVRMAKEEIKVIDNIEPSLNSYAYAFYYNALITMMERAMDDKKAKKTVEYESIKGLFMDEYKLFMKSKLITKRKKIIAILIRMRIYRLIHIIYVLLDN